jgi:D-glycero-alpha-D-manno-heptose 1-phosphate guanylyltransferase
MITEAIILAGGLGTRLKPVVGDLPKSLAPINGKPFLSYLLDYSMEQGIKKFIFALGYQSGQVASFVTEYLPRESFVFSEEPEPLGTGGAIYQAAKLATSPDVIVLNADTFFGISFANLAIIHELRRAICTIALKPMKAFERYGAVEIDRQTVIGFSEKKYRETGLINGGVYALDVEAFLQGTFPSVFSFEKDYLEKAYKDQAIMGMISDAYFIDIGIPEDYARAQTELVTQHVVEG